MMVNMLGYMGGLMCLSLSGRGMVLLVTWSCSFGRCAVVVVC
jgi:hypothetical protein